MFEFVDGLSLDDSLAVTRQQALLQTWSWAALGEHIATAILYLHRLGTALAILFTDIDI